MLLIRQRNWLGSGFKADCVESTRVNPEEEPECLQRSSTIVIDDPSTVTGHVVDAQVSGCAEPVVQRLPLKSSSGLDDLVPVHCPVWIS